MRGKRIHIIFCLLLIAGIQQVKAQDRFDDDSLNVTKFDSISVVVDTTFSKKEMKQDWSTWRPDPKRALWLALVIPGGGQIYNRKYWKLPLVYGGFIGCMYAMNWNNMMYKDYSQAYIDLMDIWVRRSPQRPTKSGMRTFSESERTNTDAGAT